MGSDFSPDLSYTACHYSLMSVVVNVTSDANNNPIYEEIEDVVRHTHDSGEIGTANNEAYGINKKQGFDMQECGAYTVIGTAI